MEKLQNKNALNRRFDFPRLFAKYVRFHSMISKLFPGSKTANLEKW